MIGKKISWAAPGGVKFPAYAPISTGVSPLLAAPVKSSVTLAIAIPFASAGVRFIGCRSIVAIAAAGFVSKGFPKPECSSKPGRAACKFSGLNWSVAPMMASLPSVVDLL